MRWETVLVFSVFGGVILLVPFIAKWVLSMGDKTRRETQGQKAKNSGEKPKNQPIVDIDKDMRTWSRWILGLAVFLLVLAGINYFSYSVSGSPTNFELAVENIGEAALLGIIGALLWARNPFVGLVWLVYVVFVVSIYLVTNKGWGFWAVLDTSYTLFLGFNLFRGWHYGYFSPKTDEYSF